MGASSSGLLDEAKLSHIKGLVDSTLQNFSVFYRQQYSAAYCGHLHQEVEPKKEGRGLLLTQRPQYDPEDVLYKGTVKFSCWDEQGKKWKERYTVLRRDYKLEVHDSVETFNRGAAAKLVLQPAGGAVLIKEEESKTLLEKTCAGILNGVKEDSSSVVSPDVFAVYLHLPFTGHTCFLFQQEEERNHFLSALKTCVRHHNIDPWCDASYESQAYIRALGLYRRDKSCYESWEMLLGTEEQVLAAQVMEEVLPWLQSQLQSRVKGKKPERIRQWLATVQATYTLVLEQLTVGLEALRGECRETASANQAQIRSNLDQIMSSHCFLEEKVRASICDEAENVCNEFIAPYMSSILEALTENISTAIQAMQRTLQTRMDAALSDKNGGVEETKVLSTLCSINLDQCYNQVDNLSDRLKDLKQRFGLNNTQRLIHSAHLEMEKLLDSAVYTLELFLQSSARLQPSQVPVKMERAKERVLKQLDYDSRVVQRRLYHEALLEITLPALTRRMDSKWKTELQQFEQYIFSDYSSFILVHNVYDDVLRNILCKEIETAVQDAASKKSNNLFLNTSDLAISQYSLLGQTPPRSAPDSPAIHARDSSCAVPAQESAPAVEEENQKVPSDPEPNADAIPDPGGSQPSGLLSPVIVVTQEVDASVTKEDSCIEESREDVHPGAAAPSVIESPAAGPCSSDAGPPKTEEPPESTDSTILVSPDHSVSSESTPPSTDVPADSAQSDRPPSPPETSAPSDHTTSAQVSEESPSAPPSTDSTLKMSLGSLSEAIVWNSAALVELNTMVQQSTDRAVYLTGDIRDQWEMERLKEENQKEAAEKEEVREKQESEGQEKEIVKDKEESGEQEKEKVKEEDESEGREKEKDEEESEGQEKEKDEEESEGQEKEKIKEEDESEGQEKEKVKDKEESGEQEKEKVKEEDESEGREKEKDEEESEGQEKEKVKEEDESEGREKEIVKEEEESGEQEKEKIKEEDESEGQEKEKVTETEGLGQEKEKMKDEEEVDGQEKENVRNEEESDGQEKEEVKDEGQSEGQEKEMVRDEEVEEQEKEKVTEKEDGEGQEKVNDEEKSEGQHRGKVTDDEERDGQEMTKEASGESSCRSCESPAEGAALLTPGQVVREEEVKREKIKENEKEAENQEDQAEKDANKDEEEQAVLQPIKSQPEGACELPLDSVAVIRGLVTEVIEVEATVSPCPDSSFAP